MKTYRADIDGDWVKLCFPFSREVIDRIKTIGSHLREWVPEEKVWRLKRGTWEQERAYIFPVSEWQPEKKQPGFFDEDDDDDDPFADVSTAPRPTTHHTVLHLLPSAPPEVIKASWQALIKKNHPDAGGDTQAAQRINAAYLALKRDL